MNVWAIAWVAFALVWAVGFGSRAALVAGQRRRRPRRWFLFGAVLGPAALLILEDAPPGTCASCLSPVEGWSMTCLACGEDVRVNRLLESLGVETSRLATAAAPVGQGEPARVVQPTPPAGVGVAVGPGRPSAASSPAGVAPQNSEAGREVGPAEALALRQLATGSPSDAPATSSPRSPQPSRTARPSQVPQPPPSARSAPATPAPGTAAAEWAPASSVAASASSSAPGAISPQLDLELRRPIRLASCVFVEGSEALVPGIWYQLTSQGGELSISGPPGSLPNAASISRPLSDVQVKTSGDRLVVTGASGSDEELRLVFKSTLDWTPLGLTHEVDARRRALNAGGSDR